MVYSHYLFQDCRPSHIVDGLITNQLACLDGTSRKTRPPWANHWIWIICLKKKTQSLLYMNFNKHFLCIGRKFHLNFQLLRTHISSQYFIFLFNSQHTEFFISLKIYSHFISYLGFCSTEEDQVHKMEQPFVPPILYCWYHACSWPGSFSSQGNNRHGIDQISWNIPSPASEELICII